MRQQCFMRDVVLVTVVLGLVYFFLAWALSFGTYVQAERSVYTNYMQLEVAGITSADSSARHQLTDGLARSIMQLSRAQGVMTLVMIIVQLVVFYFVQRSLKRKMRALVGGGQAQGTDASA